MFVRVRVPVRSFVERVAPTRGCRAILVAIGATLVVLYLALFVVDVTPHMPPPHSIGLTVAALIALTAQCAALVVSYRDQRARERRRQLRAQAGAGVHA